MIFRKNIVKKVYIEGLKCGGCVQRVENVLSTFKEIKSIRTSLEEKCSTLILKKDLDNEIIINAITDLGFNVTNIE